MNWQSIETAPKDGRRILLGYADSYAEEGCWRPACAMGSAGWYSSSDMPYTNVKHPTHWMPLPPPPVDEAKG